MRYFALVLLLLVSCTPSAPAPKRDAGPPKLAALVPIDDSHPWVFEDWRETSATSEYHHGSPCFREPVPVPPNDTSTCHGAQGSLSCDGGWSVSISGSKATARTTWAPSCVYEVQGLARPLPPQHGRFLRVLDAKARTSRRIVLAASRSPQQEALAACTGPQGQWYCPKIHRPLAATGAQPIIPASWTVGHWYIDPSNASGCASDSNSGTSATCGASGVGPLVSWQELNVHRWGCAGVPTACPRIQQNTILSYLSSVTNVSDTIVTAPSIELGTYMAIECALGTAQQSATGTLNTVTSKLRTSNQALSSTFTVTSGATAVGQLVVNTTHSNSRAWIVTSGGLLTQPLAPITAPVPFPPTLTEVDTWAHGDSFVAYTPMTVYIASIAPVVTGLDNNLDTGFYVLDCNNPYDPTNTNGIGSTFTMGMDVTVAESSLGRVASMASQGTAWDASLNVFSNGSGSYTAARVDAGLDIIFGGGTLATLEGSIALTYDYDYVFSGANEFYISYGDQPNIATAYIDTGSSIVAEPPGGVWSSAQSLGTASIYGPGSIKVLGPGNITYGPEHNATQTFPIANTGSGGGGLFIGTSSTACSHSNASPDVISCGIPITTVNLDAAQSSSAFGGNAFIPGQGSITATAFQ
jgi:hypothetical protein